MMCNKACYVRAVECEAKPSSSKNLAVFRKGCFDEFGLPAGVFENTTYCEGRKSSESSEISRVIRADLFEASVWVYAISIDYR